MSNEKIQQKFEQAYHSFIEEENYEEALKRAEILCLLNPQSVEFHHKVAYAYLKQLKWEKAIEAEMKTLELDSTYIPALDLLAHAYGALDNWEKTGFYGHQALVLKDKAIPDLEHEIIPTPAPKNGKRIISFSLFGNNSKYIEPAVLNTQLAPVLFPGWTCRFYVDDSVSAEAIQRFRNNGAEVIKVGAPLDNWPGTMWRFLAINDPEVEYVIFRDADSIICYRDAAAVSEWIKSGALFHTIRDSGSHTALILAGMWGAKAGAVPDMQERIQNFVDEGYPSRHFADQDFLEKNCGPISVRICLHMTDYLISVMHTKFPESSTLIIKSLSAKGLPALTQRLIMKMAAWQDGRCTPVLHLWSIRTTRSMLFLNLKSAVM